MHDVSGWEIAYYLWFGWWGIAVPIYWLAHTKKPTSLDDAWALLPRLREQVCLQPDGTYVRLKTSWEAVDPAKLPEAPSQPQRAPTILVGGKALEG